MHRCWLVQAQIWRSLKLRVLIVQPMAVMIVTPPAPIMQAVNAVQLSGRIKGRHVGSFIVCGVVRCIRRHREIISISDIEH